MVLVVPVLAFLASISGVLGQYTCPTGYASKAGAPNCAGANDASCTGTSCCKAKGPLCSAGAGLLNDAGNKICLKPNQWKFYDNAKASNVRTSASDADFKSACCTDYSAAKCVDWPTLLIAGTTTCGSGKFMDGTRSLPGKDENKLPTGAEYTAACCVDSPILCSAGAGLLNAAGNAICLKDNQWKFYDNAKAKNVRTSASDADFKSACCTDHSSAKCVDWPTILITGTTTCGSGKIFDGTRSLPAKTKNTPPTGAEYTAACCVPPKACSAYVAPAPTATPSGTTEDASVGARGVNGVGLVVLLASITFMV